MTILDHDANGWDCPRAKATGMVYPSIAPVKRKTR